jgi:hypothetical protein
VYGILVGEHLGKWSFGRLRKRDEDDMKMDLRDIVMLGSR